ncbi:MAG: tetratricopeptide repeat protein [Desulfobulbus sp.]|nr:tetratricopeptide repeat protein [Desulfobulbus sp.]
MSGAKRKEKKGKKTSSPGSRHLPGAPAQRLSGQEEQPAPLRRLARHILTLAPEQVAGELAQLPVAAQTAGEIARLARLCAQQNQVEKGAGLVAHGLAVLPEHPELLTAGGIVHAGAGNTQFAVECYQAALRAQPDHVEALSCLSDLLIKENQWLAAIPFLAHLAKLLPDSALVFRLLGAAYVKINQLDEALAAFRRSLELEPDHLESLLNTGICLRQMRRFDEAKDIFHQVEQRSPDLPELHNGLAWLYVNLLDYEKALVHARQACALQPGNGNFLGSQGYVLWQCSRRTEAKVMMQQALALDPANAVARFIYGMLILSEGELTEGLAYYESRFDVLQSWLQGPWPVWDGMRPEGKTLFVHHEQGVGDTIQFCRYLPLLHQAGARVLFSCQPSLVSLVGRLPGIDAIYPADTLDYAAIEADAQISLLSLMGVFRTTMATIPAACPYLVADPELVARLGQVLPSTNKYKVGIIWAGNPRQAEDHNRSLRLRQLAPLAELRDAVQFYSLQMGEPVAQIKQDGPPLGLVDLAPHIASFDHTAAFMTHMDLIVSVCTSTIHLAGALARPAVVLLHSAADWRWFLDRHDSPWYPTVRLLRQTEPGQWQPVVEELTSFIRQLCATNGSALTLGS